jgi:membrane protease subunit HflK
MSWNNQGGPWQSRGQGPWGGGPGGAPGPNDIEEAIKRLQKNLSGLPGGGVGPKAILAVLLVGLVAWLVLGTFYTVQPNEVALNLVFGRYTGRAMPGLNTNWPWPVGTVIKVPVQDQQITEVGYRSDGRGDVPSESLMLTGDQNIVDVHFRVNWRIDAAHPEDFVFNVRNPGETVKAVAESIMREVVGLKTIDGILTSDRKAMEPDAMARMQKTLDAYHVGVQVEQVQLQLVDAPAQVVSAYRDVTAAQQDQQRAVNEADTYANRIKPEAEGDAARIIAEGEAYKQQSVLDAKGQTARYAQVYEQYKKAPDVTRERLYLETMEKVLTGMSKTLLDSKAGSAPVPYVAVEPPAPTPTGTPK